MPNWLLDNVVNWLLAKAVLASLNPLWTLLSSLVFTNPDVTALPQVQALVGRSQLVVDAGFVLAVITAGITVMTHQSLQIRYGIGDVLPRLVIGFIASNFATPLCRNLITTANALTKALTGERIGSSEGFARLLGTITDAMRDPTASFLIVVIGLFLVALTATLAVSAVVRIGVLIVLVGIAPVALACHSTPYTDPAARLWWRSMLGTLAIVLLQALALYATLDILLNPTMNRSTLGLPQNSRTLNLLIVVCLLWTVVKIPGLVRRYVLGGGGRTNVFGLIIRMAMVQPLMRVPRFGRAGRTAGAVRRRPRGGGGPSAADTVIPYWRPRPPRPTPAKAGSSRPGGGAGAGGGGGQSTPRRPQVPPGVNPGTVMPKTRPAWRDGRQTPAGGSTPARPVVPAGVNPATVMPKARPAWRRP